MKVIGLDGKDYKWNPKSGGGKRSKLHKKAKEAKHDYLSKGNDGRCRVESNQF